MLSPGDAALAARDRELPVLGLALDPEAVRSALGEAFPDLVVAALEAAYVRYKVGTNVLVAWDVTTGTGSERITIKGFAGSPLRGRPVRDSRRAHLAVLWNGAARAMRLPLDLEMPALRSLLSHPRRAGLRDVRVLHYRPERRLVARALLGDLEVLVKVYRPGDYAAARERAGTVPASGACFRSQELVVSLPELSANVYRWLPGESLDTVEGPAALAGARAAGAALAGLHRLSAPPSWPARQSVAESLREACEAISILDPGLCEPVRQLAGDLMATKPAPRAPRAVHGDFAAKQVVLGAGVNFIDFDEAHAGDPEEDIGSFLAHAHRGALQGKTGAVPSTGAFLQGYEAVAGPTDSGRVRRELAIALLKLAPEPFRYRWPDWPAAAARLVERAREAADGR